jgi:hypothetical protein
MDAQQQQHATYIKIVDKHEVFHQSNSKFHHKMCQTSSLDKEFAVQIIDI